MSLACGDDSSPVGDADTGGTEVGTTGTDAATSASTTTAAPSTTGSDTDTTSTASGTDESTDSTTGGTDTGQVGCSAPGLWFDWMLATDTIEVDLPTGWFISDVDVLLNVTHPVTGEVYTSIADVDSGISTTLTSDTCGQADDIDAIFDQDAPADPDCMEPIAIEGHVLPLGNLDAYVGMQPTQTTTWELIVASLGILGGTLDEWCVIIGASETNPASCGNEALEYGEVCDASNLGSMTCEGLGFAGGTLACQPDCQAFDTSACTN